MNVACQVGVLYNTLDQRNDKPGHVHFLHLSILSLQFGVFFGLFRPFLLHLRRATPHACCVVCTLPNNAFVQPNKRYSSLLFV